MFEANSFTFVFTDIGKSFISKNCNTTFESFELLNFNWRILSAFSNDFSINIDEPLLTIVVIIYSSGIYLLLISIVFISKPYCVEPVNVAWILNILFSKSPTLKSEFT